MPKMKTHKATAKRVRFTSSGKLVHVRACQAHLLSKKSSKRKRKFAIMAEVSSVDIPRFRKLIAPAGGAK
jgi:large subunit ribosomal protein L35